MCDCGINFENNHILTLIHMQHQHITTPTFQVLLKHEENIIQNIAYTIDVNKYKMSFGQKLRIVL